MCPTFQSVWSQAWPAAAQVILCWPPGHPGQPVCWTAQHVEMSHFTVCMGFPETSVGKETACNAGDPASIPGLGKTPGEGNGYPLQYSGLENSVGCIVHGVPKSWTWLSNLHFTYHVLRASLIAQLVKNLPAMQETLVQFLGQEDPLEKGYASHSSILSFPCGSAGKESASSVEDLGSTPGLGRSPGEGKGYFLQYSGLENSMDCIVHGVPKSWTWLSNFHFLTSTSPMICLNFPHL